MAYSRALEVQGFFRAIPLSVLDTEGVRSIVLEVITS